MSSRQLHLNVNLLHSGSYASAWRLPDSDPHAYFDVSHYVRVAQIAERGKLDAIFLAGTPAITDRIEFRSFTSMEPTIVLAMVAASTKHIGLIATASTTYNEPYNIARRFATLDHASGGRSGWNAVATADAASSRNFGLPAAWSTRRAMTAPRNSPRSFTRCGIAGRTMRLSATSSMHVLSTRPRYIRSHITALITRLQAR